MLPLAKPQVASACLPNSALVMYHSKPRGCDSLHSMHHMLAKSYQIIRTTGIWQQLLTNGWSYMRNGMTMSRPYCELLYLCQ